MGKKVRQNFTHKKVKKKTMCNYVYFYGKDERDYLKQLCMTKWR